MSCLPEKKPCAAINVRRSAERFQGEGIRKVALEPERRRQVSVHALSPLTDRILKEIP